MFVSSNPLDHTMLCVSESSIDAEKQDNGLVDDISAHTVSARPDAGVNCSRTVGSSQCRGCGQMQKRLFVGYSVKQHG